MTIRNKNNYEFVVRGKNIAEKFELHRQRWNWKIYIILCNVPCLICAISRKGKNSYRRIMDFTSGSYPRFGGYFGKQNQGKFLQRGNLNPLQHMEHCFDQDLTSQNQNLMKCRIYNQEFSEASSFERNILLIAKLRLTIPSTFLPRGFIWIPSYDSAYLTYVNTY